MSRGKLEDMEQKETSEVDWIICFALIQSRNPTLWKRALSRKKGDVEDVGALKSEKNLKINPRENSKHIYKWVAPFENGFLNNKSLFAHLEPIYNFLCQNKYKSFEDAVGLKELQSFSKDVSTADINNWFLPRYKILLKILSLKTKEIDFRGLSQVFQTLQVLLVSHYSHRIDSDSSFKRTLIDVHVFNFIAKFLFNRILLKKNQNDPKWLQNFYDQGDGKHLCDKVDYKRLCSLHFTLIYSIINIQLIKIKTNQTFVPQILKYVSVLKLIEHILIIIESLIHTIVSKDSNTLKYQIMFSLQDVITTTKTTLAAMPKGYLPKWLLFISIVSVFNSIQTYVSGLELTRKVYERKPTETTHLSARTFGTWTFISCVIRFYGAMYLNEPHIFELVFMSYMVALFHFGSELLIFRTCKLGKGFMGPLVVSTTSLVWMYKQREYYTGVAW
ncbi:Mei4p [Saccharomyces cerevisiae]|nr:Meiosis-specific protein [Saccharomyces boulardii (nom. inval.)]PJP10785.1 Mei4p [Saccharomyces cerevisiae]PTN16305.1 Mei4p [Saccharomyces cerevisiae]PTN20767.1 Mei4p [Saccharomyces cerevisiae]PTN31346.1 Mei4p [Saccharomyces cerevisiae]